MTHLKRLIAVFIVFLTAFLFIPIGKANECTAYKPNRVDTPTFHAIEDVNYYEKYTYTTEHVDNLYSMHQIDAFYVSDDDRIKDVIPLECFINPGTYAHIGIKYGFFVQTQQYDSWFRKSKDYYYVNPEDAYKNLANYCEVYIFKINRTIDRSTMAIITSIEPAYSVGYVYHWFHDSNTYRICPITSCDQTIGICYAKNECSFQNNVYYTDNSNISYFYKGYGDMSDKNESIRITRSYNLCADLLGYAIRIIFHCQAAQSFTVDILKAFFSIMDDYNWYWDDMVEDFNKKCLDSYHEDQLLSVLADVVDITNEFVKSEYLEVLSFFINLVSTTISVIGTTEIDNILDIGTVIFDIVSTTIQASSVSFDLFLKLFNIKFDFDTMLSKKGAIVGDISLAFDSLYDLYLWLAMPELPRYGEKINVGSSLQVGSTESIDYKLVYNGDKSDYRVTFRNGINFKNYYSQNSVFNDTVTFNTTLYFVDQEGYATVEMNDEQLDRPVEEGDKQIYQITSCFKLNVCDDTKSLSGNYSFINAPDFTNKTAVTENVFYSGGNKELITYFKPKEDGDYSIKIIGQNGKYTIDNYTITNINTNQPVTTFKKGTIYKITFNYEDFVEVITFEESGSPRIDKLLRTNMIGNHTISMEVSLCNDYKGHIYYTCNSTGWYYIEIDAYYLVQRNNTLKVNSVYYSSLCGGTYYSYTRNYYAEGLQKVYNYTFKVKLQAGHTYTIDYACTTNQKLKVYKVSN